jgi:hypothetical protein
MLSLQHEFSRPAYLRERLSERAILLLSSRLFSPSISWLSRFQFWNQPSVGIIHSSMSTEHPKSLMTIQHERMSGEGKLWAGRTSVPYVRKVTRFLIPSGRVGVASPFFLKLAIEAFGSLTPATVVPGLLASSGASRSYGSVRIGSGCSFFDDAWLKKGAQ